MKTLHKFWLAVFFLALLQFTGGCTWSTAPAADEKATVNLWVTRDFGEETIFSAEIPLNSDQSVLSLLQEHLEVETEYGGGFISAINGLESGYSAAESEGVQKTDWFYYVNGILSGQGAATYVPAGGDHIWWDYHLWSDTPFVPAVIGAFPQPFLGGFQGNNPGTLILSGDGCGEQAEQLARFLEEQGCSSVEISPYCEEKAAKRSQIVLVVALWEQLEESSFWQGIQQHRDSTGWFAELTSQGFYPLDRHASRQGEKYHEGAGAILSTGSGLADPHPLWLVTATDREGLEGTVETLLKKTEQFAQKTGVLVSGGDIIGLPLNAK
ncbi:MAG: DUF4430 domain-containing protein [Firmicutes bacterium]|jgi:hypothetical protein|nr:DUF4430 domain-containing protein [Bacillota bacterium]